MLNRFRYILFTLLALATFQAAGQYSIDKVCVGSTRHYRIDGVINSSYTWKLVDPSGNSSILGSTADTVEISWNVAPGIYSLSSVQHSPDNCDALLEIGEIEVMDQPTAFAGNPINICSEDSIALYEAAAINYSILNWTTSGDGYFDDPTQLYPTYILGFNDKQSGNVILTLTVQGQGNTNSCVPATSSVTIHVSSLAVVLVQSTDATCGQTNGTITITTTGGNGVIQYSIDDGTTWFGSNLFTDLPAGSYLIKVKDNNCEVPYASNPIIISTIGGPQIAAVGSTDATCGQNNGTITITANGGSGAILYSIDDGTTWFGSNLLTDLPAGSYIIKVKDDNCEVPYISNPIIISTIGGPQIAAVGSTDATCGQNNGTITITANGGSGAILYSIDDGTTWFGSNLLTDLPAGSYIIKVKDNNCEVPYASNPIIIITIGGSQITAVSSTDATCGQNNGTITITANGGSGAILYSIDDGTTWFGSNLLTDLPAGSYIIKVKDDNCEVPYISNPIIISTIGGPQIAAVGSTDATCGQNNGTITITANGGSGAILYSIDDGTTWFGSNLLTDLPAGSYLIKVKDNNCEVPYASNPIIIITIGGSQITAVSSTDATCGQNNGTITITATGGSGAIMYSIDNGTTWFGSNLFTDLPAGSYIIKVKDDNCEVPYTSNPVIISTIGGPQIEAVSSTDATCGQNNGTITITAIGGSGIIQYSIDNGTTWFGSNLFTDLPAGSYIIKVKDDNCEVPYTLNPVIISTIGGPQIAAVSSTDATCSQNNGTITITAIGGSGVIQYSIDDGTTWFGSNLFTDLPAGSYIIKVKDDNCEVPYTSNQVIISTIGGPQIEAVSSTDATCGQNNGTITITATGGSGAIKYSIDNGTTWFGSNLFTDLPAGSYIIKVKDDNCEVPYTSNPVIISTIGGPQIEAVSSTDATCGQNNGTITITAIGGSGIIQYSIDNGTTWFGSNLFTDLPAGSYIIKIKDDNCEVPYTLNPVIISTIGGPQIISVSSTDAACGQNNGTITITAIGGSGIIQYSIDDGTNWSGSNLFTDLPAGSYIIKIKDDNCEFLYSNSPVIIYLQSKPTISNFLTTGISCHGSNDGTITAIIQGGIPPYYFQWNDPAMQTTVTATGLSSATYKVYVTDAEGCSDSSAIFISQPDSVLALNASISDILCSGGNDGAITIMPYGGTQPYSYNWNNGKSGDQLSNLAAGSYHLVLADASGCIIDTVFTLKEPETFRAIAEIIVPVQTIGGSATISVTATGGTAPYSGTGEYFTSAGTFSFKVTDSIGCETYATISIPDAGKVMAADSSACLGDHIAIPINVFGFRDIATFKLKIKYAPEILKCVGFRYINEEILSGTSIYSDTLNGKISVSCSLDTPASIQDSSQLIVIEFITKAPGKSMIAFDDSIPGQNVFYNVNNQQIIVQYSQGRAEVMRPPLVEIIGERSIPAGQSIELNAMVWTGNPISYQWTIPWHTTLTGSSLRIDPAFEENTGFYVINVLDKNGCASTDSALVQVGARSIMRVEIPSAFSPNGDGLNEVFLAYTNMERTFKFKMLVFNKWGQQIFESSDISKGWDGTFKGQDCPSDLYTWVVYYEVPIFIEVLQKSPQKGVVMLMR